MNRTPASGEYQINLSGVWAVPQNFLIDPEGKIIAVGLRKTGGMVSQKLDEVLTKHTLDYAARALRFTSFALEPSGALQYKCSRKHLKSPQLETVSQILRRVQLPIILISRFIKFR